MNDNQNVSSFYFDEKGRFRSVELATQHAILQGGFTTPTIEAQRMIRDRDPQVQEMGKRWIREHHE